MFHVLRWLPRFGLAAGMLLGSHLCADGLIVIRNPPRVAPGHYPFAPLEIKFHHVTVHIKDQLATTEVDQVFFNPNASRLEGTYIFPIPRNAQINKFMMDVNGKMQEAELLDAAKARSVYEDIVRRALDPALLEYVGQGLFKLRVFPIEPHSEKRIRLSYTQLLRQDGGLVDYLYPLNTEKFSSKPLESVSIKVVLETGQVLKSLYSPSHEVEISRKDAHHATIGFEARGIKPDTDFQFLFSTQASSEIGMSLLTYRDEHDPEGYFLLLASPGDSQTVMKKDVVFVLDTSGSMADGGKLAQAKRALNFCLSNLGEGDHFEVVRFSTEPEALFEKLVDSSEVNRAKARAFIEKLDPIGGTAMDGAMTTALGLVKQSDSNRPFIIVLLTDGRPTIGYTNEREILAHALRGAGDRTVRIFCIGIGTDVNTHLLDELSSRTRAVSQYVLPQEDLELKMSSFYTKISHPVLANPNLSASGEVRLTRTYPQPLPDLFKGEQLVVVGRYKGAQESLLSICGSVNGETRTYKESASFPAKATELGFIPKLWATRRIGMLLDEIRLRGEDPELRNEVVELARRYGIVTPYTAYLIVEDEAHRAVPMGQRTMQMPDLISNVRGSGRNQFRGVNSSSSGEMAVAGSQAFDKLKRAENMSATAAANSASQMALTGKDAKEGELLQNALNAQQNRVIAGRTFYQNGSQWIDSNVQSVSGAKITKIRFNSPEYYSLMAKDPSVPQWLSVGRNVQIQLGQTIYDIID